MIVYKQATTENELEGILLLQQQNLASVLSAEERESQGFVTVVHRLDNLTRMNEIENHIIAKEDSRVIAYLLSMTEQSKDHIPVLRPMFAAFQNLFFAGKPVSAYRYMVVGQVCVDKPYRGTGVLNHCYAFFRQTFRRAYDFAITEIDASNRRSLAAHHRIGFEALHRYTAPDGKEWVIVLWDWNRLVQ